MNLFLTLLSRVLTRVFQTKSYDHSDVNLPGAGELEQTLGMKEERSSVTPPETSAMLQC